MMSKCNITHGELSDALDISPERLYEICDRFDEDPDDDWELVEGIHFVWTTHKARIFSPEGAIEICNYLEENQSERPLLKRWKRWLLQRDRKLKGLMVAKKVQEVSGFDGQLLFVNSRAFLAPRACREILGLGRRQDVLNRAFREVQIPTDGNLEKEPMKPDEDFFISDQQKKYFSKSGISVVSKHLGTTLTRKHRREWMRVVADYAPRALTTIEQHEIDREKRIERVKDRVRRQARGRCQITNRRCSVGSFNLDVHHIFDQNTYPQFADLEINLIAIDDNIHAQFHQWMGGTHVSCTVEDFEKYIEEFSGSLFVNSDAEQLTKVAMHLSRVREMLRQKM